MREKFDYVYLDSLITDYHGFEPQENDDENPLSSWVPWYTFGSKTVFNHKKIPNNYNFDNENYEKLNEAREEVLKDFPEFQLFEPTQENIKEYEDVSSEVWFEDYNNKENGYNMRKIALLLCYEMTKL